MAQGLLFEWSVTDTFYSIVISTTGIPSHAVVFRGVVSPYSPKNGTVWEATTGKA